MERVACNFCGADAAAPIHELQDLRQRLPGCFTLVQCGRCGLLYLNPQPSQEELAPHYPKQYHAFTGAIEDQASALVRWARRYGVRRRGRAVTRRQPGGRLLDIGCATGVFLNEMRHHGVWELYGIEPAASAAEFARRRFGLQIFQGTLLDTAYPDDFFDVVTMWDVLEHVADPQAHLREIGRILKPGGWLALKVPDLSSWEARLFGPYWAGHEAPRHLFGFSRYVLTRQLVDLGFEAPETARLGGDYATFMLSAGYWLDAHGGARLAPAVRRLARSSAARVLTAPAFALLRRAGLGSSLTCFARKKMRGE
jgi:SAM-dependent methyltransferase